jgi:aminodeoxyfutalosine synthase
VTDFATITAKTDAGERLTDADALFLFASPELLQIGTLAARVNERKNGRRVFFNVNRHLNHTNICVNRCKFCAFGKDAGDAGAYCHDLDEIRNRALEAAAQGATELHIVGGLHPELPFAFYLDLLRTVREAAPALHLKAFTTWPGWPNYPSPRRCRS